jgi:hypothetical protein
MFRSGVVMMNVKARLSVGMKGTQFVVEAFDQSISVEQQPDGPKRVFNFLGDPLAATVYSSEDAVWDLPALTSLIARYESAIHDIRELSTWEAEGGNPPVGAGPR